MSILDEILKNRRRQVGARKSAVPLPELKARIRDANSVKPFGRAIRREQKGPLKLIAELKKASPSQGLIRKDFDLPGIISVYNNKNVDAISVLTEESFFMGKTEFLKDARRMTGKPLLRKDFILDEYQVYEARAYCADAILLIASALEKSQLNDLYWLAKELGLDSLVEVHSWKELEAALSGGADIIGINNRDLSTLNISLNITFEMIRDIPQDRIVVSESGIQSRNDVESIESTRVDAILVGTTIMKAEDMGAKIDELMGRE